MRTTLTLDRDVARELRREMARHGRTLRDVANDALRVGLGLAAPAGSARRRFVVEASDLGGLSPGVRLDDVRGLLDEMDIEDFQARSRPDDRP